MKKIILSTLTFLVVQITLAQSISFEILKNKTEVDSNNVITLYVKLNNNSNDEIVIFKPAVALNQKWRCYYRELECSDPVLWSSSDNIKEIPYDESDFIIVPAKSKNILKINGMYNANLLSCSSKAFRVKLIYNSKLFFKNLNDKNLNSQEIDLIKKLTPIIIESKKTNIKIMKTNQQHRIFAPKGERMSD